MKSLRHRVLVVDDHPIVRQGLVALLERQDDLEVAADVASAPEAEAAVRRDSLDLVIMDLALDGSSGLGLTRELLRIDPSLRVLVLSFREEAIYACRALEAGARGYIKKGASPGELLHAIRTVLGGDIYLGPSVEHLRAGRPEPDGPSGLAVLSPREFGVFQCLGKGLAPRHIARQLGLSVSTVETYRKQIRQKLLIKNAPTLTRFAVDWVRSQEDS